MSGRSQAVRLPKEFRFDVDRVIIRREGRHVVQSPPFKDWEDVSFPALFFTVLSRSASAARVPIVAASPPCGSAAPALLFMRTSLSEDPGRWSASDISSQNIL